MSIIHRHYDQLTELERAFVDNIFDGKHMYQLAQEMGVPLAGDDRVERAVDAFARAVIESRPKVKEPEPTKPAAIPEPEPEVDEIHLTLKLAGHL